MEVYAIQAKDADLATNATIFRGNAERRLAK
jgi:hypothetical protein